VTYVPSRTRRFSTLEKYVADMVASYERRKVERVQTTTDANGAFVLSELIEAEYWPEAYQKGYQIERSQRRGWRALKPGDEIEFIAKPRIEVPVTVAFASGKSPEEASIEWKVEAGGNTHSSNESWTPEDPTIVLSPGTFKLRATAGKDGEYTSEEREVALKAGEAPDTVAFTLKGRPGIKGVVKFPKGEEPENAVVLMTRVAPGSAPDLESARQNGENQQWLGRHNEYAFAFKDLAPGSYAIGAARGHEQPFAVVEQVEVADTVVTRDLVFPALDPADYVVVWVYGPENEIIKDAQIQASLRSKRGSWSGGGTAVPRPDGSYWLLHPQEPEHMRNMPQESDDAIKYSVSAHTERFGRKEVEYEPKKGVVVEVRFTVPAELQVLVTNYAGSGYEGKVNVGIQKAAKGKRGESSQDFGGHDKVDFEGKKTLGPVEPGEYELVMYVQSDRYGQKPVARQPVTLAAGKNSASFPIPPLYAVTVIVAEPKPNMHLDLQPLVRQDGYWGGGQQVNKEGRVVFSTVAPGEYRLRSFGGAGMEEMRINVQGDLEVRFEPKAMNALEVTIGEEDGVLAQAGFRNGDMIIGVDGKEIENLAQIQMAMFANAERVTLTVLRDGRKVELPVEPRKLMEAGNSGKGMGGEIEPTAR
jgi:membrane-associated protease RseP (regulator of RpoE activity)